MALKLGQKRVNDAREYLNRFANGKAMPALALKDNKTNVWEPVGEENLLCSCKWCVWICCN